MEIHIIDNELYLTDNCSFIFTVLAERERIERFGLSSLYHTPNKKKCRGDACICYRTDTRTIYSRNNTTTEWSHVRARSFNTLIVRWIDLVSILFCHHLCRIYTHWDRVLTTYSHSFWQLNWKTNRRRTIVEYSIETPNVSSRNKKKICWYNLVFFCFVFKRILNYKTTFNSTANIRGNRYLWKGAT